MSGLQRQPRPGREQAVLEWGFGEPNGLFNTQDCLEIGGHGAWNDDHCTETEEYICEAFDECPGDPAKTFPGQCGCGTADTDSDGDGTPATTP